MYALLNRYKNLIILLLYINIGIILSQEEKCTTITHCKKCPDQNKCEICEDGFKINEENKCIEVNNNGQNNPAGSSPKKSSHAYQRNTPAGSQQNPPAGSQPPQQNPPAGSAPPQQNQPSGAQQPQQNQPSGAQHFSVWPSCR